MTYTAQQQCRRHSWNRRKAAFDNRCEKIAAKTVKIKIVWNFWNCLNFFEKRCWQKRKTMVWYNTLKAMSRKQSGKIKWQQKNVEKSKKSTWQTEIKVVKYISCQTKKRNAYKQIAGCGSAWLERLVWDQEVAGSNPVTPTEILNFIKFICGCSSMVEHQPSKLDTWVRFPSPALWVCSSVG